MDMTLKETVLRKWQTYFRGADLPFVFFYSDDGRYESALPTNLDEGCFVARLKPVLDGATLALSADTIACPGGSRCTGFTRESSRQAGFLLSGGLPCEAEAPLHKATEDLAAEAEAAIPTRPARGRYLVLKRWDTLEASEDPLVVVSFAEPDVLSGLFTLANYHDRSPMGVITPFCSGCSSIVAYPLAEAKRDRPRAVLGMLDFLARPWVNRQSLSFAAPWSKFVAMMAHIDISVLTTGMWQRLAKRFDGEDG